MNYELPNNNPIIRYEKDKTKLIESPILNYNPVEPGNQLFDRPLPEVFRLITCYNIKPLYYVSNYGRVFSVNKGQMCFDKSGMYNRVKLRTHDNDLEANSPVKRFFVHRLVAEMFIPKTNEDIYLKREYVNHKNAIQVDNFVLNLEWCTTEENNNHARNYYTNLYPNLIKPIERPITKRDTPVKGSEVGTSIFTEDQVHLICQIIESNIDPNNLYADCCKALNLEYNKNNVSIISSIRYKKTWIHISDQYNFNFERPEIFNYDKYKDDIIKYLKDGYNINEVVKLVGLEELGKKAKSCVRRLVHKLEAETDFVYGEPEQTVEEHLELINPILRREYEKMDLDKNPIFNYNPVDPGNQLFDRFIPEKFRLIDCFDIKPMYYISTYGRIFSIKGRQLKYGKDCRVELRINNLPPKKKSPKFMIPRLVAEMFIPRSLEDLELGRNIVHHINLINQDNFIFNLLWVNQSESSNYNIDFYKTIYPDLKHPIERYTKKRTKPLAGSEIGNATITEEQVHAICKVLQDNKYPINQIYAECCKAAGLENNKTNRDRVSNIKAKQAWKHISDQYTFGTNSRYFDYTPYMNDIIKYIKEGFRPNEIADKVGLKEQGKKAQDYISKIKRKMIESGELQA